MTLLKFYARSFTGIFMLLAPGLSAYSAATNWVPGWDELTRLDRLAMFRTSAKVGSVSSYDRSGGNDDGFSGKYSFIRQEPEGLVLADLTGPGIIYRIWTPTPSDDLLEFFFDGETTPRIQVPFRDLFLGKHQYFPLPLVGYGAGGFYSYVPLPFAQSCKVRMRAKKVQFYQINYALYDKSAPIATWATPVAREQRSRYAEPSRLFEAAGSDISRAVAPPGSSIQVTRASLTVAPQSTTPVFRTEEPGRLVGLRFSPATAVISKAHDLTLRISFDNEEPAVLCPLGDFFGFAWGQPAMQSLLVGAKDNTLYAYFPMPFDRSATLEIQSDRTGPAELTAEVLFAPVRRATNEGRFYAVWRRENPTQTGKPFTFIDTQGTGHLVGFVLQSQGLESGKTLFFEGDDQTTIDGELVIHGTGSEDFFNGGWYDVPDRWEKQISFPLSGCLGYAKHLGRTGGYRLLLGDAYAFRRSIKQTIEHSGSENNIPTDYCAVTYLYAAQRPAASLTLPPLAERKVIDLNEVIFPAWWQLPIHAFTFNQAALTRRVEKIGSEEVRFLSLTASGQDWFGPPFVSPICELPGAGTYEILIEAIKGPAQAQVQLFQNEIPVAEAVDLYAEQRAKSGRVSLGKLNLAEGRNTLMLKLVGKNDKANGLALDLIQVVCVRVP